MEMEKQPRQPSLEDEAYRQSLIDGVLKSKGKDKEHLLDIASGLNDILEHDILGNLDKLDPDREGFDEEEKNRRIRRLLENVPLHFPEAFEGKEIKGSFYQGGVLYQEMIKYAQDVLQTIEKPYEIEEIRELLQRGRKIHEVLHPLWVAWREARIQKKKKGD